MKSGMVRSAFRIVVTIMGLALMGGCLCMGFGLYGYYFGIFIVGMSIIGIPSALIYRRKGRFGLAARIVLDGIALVLLLMLLFFGSILYSYYLAPEKKSLSIPSPDGKYKAYVGVRGFMDSANASLYVVEKGRTHRIENYNPQPSVELIWAPDSRKIALVDSSFGLQVVCIDGRHSKVYCGTPDPWRESQQEKERIEGQRRGRADLDDPEYNMESPVKWIDASAIIIEPVYENQNGSTVKSAVVRLSVSALPTGPLIIQRKK
jgi:hypothetical protein